MVDSVDMIDSVDVIDSVDMVNSVDMIGSVDTIDVVGLVDRVDSVDMIDSVDICMVDSVGIVDSEGMVHLACHVPHSLKKQLNQTVDSNVMSGVLCKVDQPNDWVNNLVVVEKANGSLRLCLDPKDVNKAIKREHHKIPTIQEISSELNNSSIAIANRKFIGPVLSERSCKFSAMQIILLCYHVSVVLIPL